MRFFLPTTNDAEQAEITYAEMKAFVLAEYGSVSSRRYFAVYHQRMGKEVVTKVGKPAPYRELVIAIVRTERESAPFLVFTPGHGAQSGNLLLAHSGPGTKAIEFEEPAGG